MVAQKSIFISVPIQISIEKKFKVNLIPHRGEKYKDDVDWIAHWFYNYYGSHIDDLKINIKGNEHTTFPNPPHISVSFEYDGYTSPMHHLSLDRKNGMIYLQPLPTTSGNIKKTIGNKSKGNKSKGNKRKSKNNKTNKRKSKRQ